MVEIEIIKQNLDGVGSIGPGHLDSGLQTALKNIPSKLSFKISEVVDLLNVKAHILRYWEVEFESFKPRKMPNGQRLYFRKDIEMALLIKKLLYQDGFSLKGAKKAIKELKKEKRQYKKQSFSEQKILKHLNQIQDTISSIRDMIK